MVSDFKSAKLKFARAAKHLRAIKRCIAKYSASRPHKIVKKTKGKKKINIPKAPPRELCILTGEMVYQMRSALDHLAFDIVRRNATRTTLPANWIKHCEFPICIAIPVHGNPPIPHPLPAPHKIFKKTLPGVSKKVLSFIESIQPYYRIGAINNCLLFLADLSNIDKHRYLNLVRPRVKRYESVRFASGLSSRGHQALDRGAKIHPLHGWDESDRPEYVNRHYRTFVVFEERRYWGEATALPVEDLLKLILDHINSIIIPAFAKFVKNP